MARRTFSLSNSSLRWPHWQRAYQAMLLETDTCALFKHVEVAEAAVLTRRADLEGSANHHAERHAMEEALTNLRHIKKDRLKFG